MFRFIMLFILTLLIGFGCKSTKKLESNSIEKSTAIPEFPMDWIGHYEGTLHISTPGGESNEVIMQLIINAPDAEGYFPWTIIYGEKDVRRYGLEVINSMKGHYRINEYNSIEMDAFLISNHFISHFTVMGNDLIVDYEKTNEDITALFYISNINSQIQTGGEIIGQDTIPDVTVYPIQVFQKATLKKKE